MQSINNIELFKRIHTISVKSIVMSRKSLVNFLFSDLELKTFDSRLNLRHTNTTCNYAFCCAYWLIIGVLAEGSQVVIKSLLSSSWSVGLAALKKRLLLVSLPTPATKAQLPQLLAGE